MLYDCGITTTGKASLDSQCFKTYIFNETIVLPIEVELQPGEYCLVAITNNLTKFFTRNMASFYSFTESNTATVYSQRSDSEMGFNHEPLYRILPYSRVSEGENSVELYRTEYILAINNDSNSIMGYCIRFSL